MGFWDFWETKEEVKIKNLTLTYYEVNQILSKLDSDYKKQRDSDSSSERSVGRHGIFTVSKVRRTFKKFFKRKYKYK